MRLRSSGWEGRRLHKPMLLAVNTLAADLGRPHFVAELARRGGKDAWRSACEQGDPLAIALALQYGLAHVAVYEGDVRCPVEVRAAHAALSLATRALEARLLDPRRVPKGSLADWTERYGLLVEFRDDFMQRAGEG